MKLKVLPLSLREKVENFLLLSITEVAMQHWRIIGRWNHSSFKCLWHFALKTESGASLDKASKVWTSKSNMSIKMSCHVGRFLCLLDVITIFIRDLRQWGLGDRFCGFFLGLFLFGAASLLIIFVWLLRCWHSVRGVVWTQKFVVVLFGTTLARKSRLMWATLTLCAMISRSKTNNTEFMALNSVPSLWNRHI